MISTVIFDLDGTLLNTLEDLTDSVNHIMVLHGFPERTIDEIRSFIGNGIPTLIRRSVPKGTDEETAKTCTAEMKEYYKAHARIKTVPYDGISGLLNELKQRNIKTAVVTNKAEPAAKILCNEIFGDVFTTVIGDNGIDRLKPAPDNVIRAINLLQSEKENILYVGDSDVAMVTAENAGLTSVGVLWGFRDRDVLVASGADYVISKPSELLTIIEKSK